MSMNHANPGYKFFKATLNRQSFSVFDASRRPIWSKCIKLQTWKSIEREHAISDIREERRRAVVKFSLRSSFWVEHYITGLINPSHITLLKCAVGSGTIVVEFGAKIVNILCPEGCLIRSDKIFESFDTLCLEPIFRHFQKRQKFISSNNCILYINN